MPHYLLAVHSSSDPSPDSHSNRDAGSGGDQLDFAAMMALEEDLQSSGAWVFSGGLTGADMATVVRRDSGRPVMTDGPFVESKEHLAGFYVIEAADLDQALDWADRVTACVGAPIEVRPFAATGDLKSQMGDAT